MKKNLLSLIFLLACFCIQSQTGVVKPAWELLGSTTNSNNFLGTKNAQPLIFKTNNVSKFRIAVTDTFVFNNVGSGIKFLPWSLSPTYPGIYINQTTPGGNNYQLTADAGVTYLNGPQILSMRADQLVMFNITAPVAPTSTINGTFNLTSKTYTATQPGRNVPGFQYNNHIRTWTTSAPIDQYDFYVKSALYSGNVAMTFTNTYGAFIEKPTAGTNATFLNNWGIGTNGSGVITQSLVVGSAAHTPSYALEVTGNSYFSGPVSIGSSNTVTAGNTGTLAVLSDAVFQITFNHSAISFADASTYYFGNVVFPPVTTPVSNGTISIPYNCTLVSWTYNSIVAGVVASSETSTLSIAGTTNYTLSSSITYTAANGYNSITATGLSQNFNANDNINIKEITGTWGTNPTSLSGGLTLWFVRRP